MASPNKTKLPEQHTSSSNPPARATAGLPSAETTEDQGQKQDEVAVLTPIPDASDTAKNRFEQPQGEPNPAAPATAGDIPAGAVPPPQQDQTQAITMAPAIAMAANDVVSDDEEDSNDEFQEKLNSDDVDNDLDDKIFVEPEPKAPPPEILDIRALSLFNAEHGREMCIVHDPRNYGISEVNASDDEDGGIAEAIRNSLAEQATPDQAVSSATGESAHGGGEGSGAVSGAAAGFGHDEAVTTAPLGPDICDGDNNVSTTPAPSSSDQGDGENRVSMTPTSTGSDHGDAEHSDPATPALTLSNHNQEGNNEPRIPSSAGSGHEHKEHDSPVAATPAGSDNSNEENKDSAAAAPADPDDGSRESGGSMTPASASSTHGNTGGSSSETAAPAGVDHVNGGNNNSVAPSVASEEGIPSPSQEGKGKMKELRDEQVPGDSGAPTEETPSDTTDEGEVPDPMAPPAQDAEEAASQAGAEADHEHEVIDLLPPEMPDPPLEPTQPLGEDVLAYDLEEREVTSNPVDRVSILTGYQRPEVEALAAEEEEQRRTLEALYNRRDDSEGTEDPADTALGANTDDNIEDHSGESGEDVGSGDSDQGASQDLVVKTCKDSDQDSDTVHLKVEYRVQYSNHAKATMCISIPVTITYPALKQTILSALRKHGDFENPRPAHKEAKIARLVVVFAKKDEESDFCRTIELTDENLEETLRLMPKRSIYDVVKVQFEPGTNGEARPKKATGKVYGKSRKVGGL